LEENVRDSGSSETHLMHWIRAGWWRGPFHVWKLLLPHQ